MCVCVCVYIYIVIYIYVCVCVGAARVPKGYNQIYSGVQVLTIHQQGVTESLHGCR